MPSQSKPGRNGAKEGYLPVGAVMTSWSRVRHFPPAFTILALAVSVKRRAATVIFGTSRSLLSSVTAPTTTAILVLKRYFRDNNLTYCPWRCLASLESERGGLLVREATSLLSTVLQNAESVLLVRKRKSLISRWMYRLVLLVSLLLECFILPLLTRSIPYKPSGLVKT